MTKSICDRCGKAVDPITCGFRIEPLKIGVPIMAIDLCEDCQKKVKSFIFDQNKPAADKQTNDENELIRALQYDREQYEKGYADGYLDCLREIDAGDVQELLEEGYHIVNDIPMKPPEVEE